MTETKESHLAKSELRELLRNIKKLSLTEKTEIIQHLLGKDSGLTVILDGSNTTNKSFSIQLEGSAEDISQQLQHIPSEIFFTLMKAIAIRIAQDEIGL